MLRGGGRGALLGGELGEELVEDDTAILRNRGTAPHEQTKLEGIVEGEEMHNGL